MSDSSSCQICFGTFALVSSPTSFLTDTRLFTRWRIWLTSLLGMHQCFGLEVQEGAEWVLLEDGQLSTGLGVKGEVEKKKITQPWEEGWDGPVCDPLLFGMPDTHKCFLPATCPFFEKFFRFRANLNERLWSISTGVGAYLRPATIRF